MDFLRSPLTRDTFQCYVRVVKSILQNMGPLRFPLSHELRQEMWPKGRESWRGEVAKRGCPEDFISIVTAEYFAACNGVRRKKTAPTYLPRDFSAGPLKRDCCFRLNEMYFGQ